MVFTGLTKQQLHLECAKRRISCCVAHQTNKLIATLTAYDAVTAPQAIARSLERQSKHWWM
jgi:hypothetical protein